MMKIEFDGICINAPTKWEDVSLKDYESWYLQKPETRLEHIQHVADICKLDVKIFLNAPSKLFEIVSEAISFSFNQDFEPKNEITIGKEKYWINYSDKLTLGEWVDMDAVINGEGDDKLSELLSILCRPIGETYNSENIEKRKKLFQEQSCDKVIPLISFFLLKEKKSKEISNRSLAIIAQGNQYLQDMQTFAQNGDGIKRFPIWRRIRYTYLTRLLEKQLTKCSAFFSTELTNHKQKETR